MRFIFLTVLLASITSGAQANSRYSVQSFDANQCQVAGHPEEYVLRVCPIVLNNNDHVVISGTHQRSNLEVQRGNQNNNPYYMPLGVDNADYSVDGNIDVVLRRNALGQNVRHALIYKLNYRTYDGRTGYQIITVRMGTGLGAANRTCMVYAFDSEGATRFAGLTGAAKEAAMREQALRQTQSDDFQNSRNSCLRYEHSHDHPESSVTFPTDPEEGDSLEVGI